MLVSSRDLLLVSGFRAEDLAAILSKVVFKKDSCSCADRRKFLGRRNAWLI
jgi:hypothetical protein